MRDAPSEGFRRLLNQIARRAAKNEKSGRIVFAINQNANDLEQTRRTLNLVNYHQAFQLLQREHGLLQPSEMGWVLQIEFGNISGRRLGEYASQGRLAALARSQQGNDGMHVKCDFDHLQIGRSVHKVILM